MAKHLILLLVFLFSGLIGFSQSKEVLISTKYGSVKFFLYDETPKHRDAFLKLVKEEYFNGTLFYRVIKDFMIQGGSKSTKSAQPGAKTGFGDPSKSIENEISKTLFHKKGALCAPRQPDKINPQKKSDISQFYIARGRVYRNGELDTLELVVNRPIRNKIGQKYLTSEVKAELNRLKENKDVVKYKLLADKVKMQIETDFNGHPGIRIFTPEQRNAYTTIGGCPDLDGDYTVFGECVSGFEAVEKILRAKTDANNRPLEDIRISVSIIEAKDQ